MNHILASPKVKSFRHFLLCRTKLMKQIIKLSSYLKTATESFIVTLKENKFSVPNKLLLMLLCAESLEKNGLRITRQMRNKTDHSTRMQVTVMVTNCSHPEWTERRRWLCCYQTRRRYSLWSQTQCIYSFQEQSYLKMNVNFRNLTSLFYYTQSIKRLR